MISIGLVEALELQKFIVLENVDSVERVLEMKNIADVLNDGKQIRGVFLDRCIHIDFKENVLNMSFSKRRRCVIKEQLEFPRSLNRDRLDALVKKVESLDRLLDNERSFVDSFESFITLNGQIGENLGVFILFNRDGSMLLRGIFGATFVLMAFKRGSSAKHFVTMYTFEMIKRKIRIKRRQR